MGWRYDELQDLPLDVYEVLVAEMQKPPRDPDDPPGLDDDDDAPE